MILHVTSVRHMGDYRLQLEFNNGRIKKVDLAEELYGEVFEPLRDLEEFKRVFLNVETGTLEWPNGADLAPEFLSDIGEDVERVA